MANALRSTATPLIPDRPALVPLEALGRPPERIVFPLSPDHLITLLQFNVLRGLVTNRSLLLPLLKDDHLGECSSTALQILPSPTSPQEVPPSLQPTVLQRTIPHEDWIDVIPHPVLRDNLILSSGKFDEDGLWSDTVGGLFEGFPASEIEQRGVIAWSPPWHVSGWEFSEGFWRKWGWSLKGCPEALEATNKWRRKRGEKPLVVEL